MKVTEKNAQGAVTQVVEYVYDVFDRRNGRKLDTTAPFNMADAAIERYVLDDIHNGLVSADGGNVVLDFVDPDGSGAQPMTLSKRYLYGEAVDQLFAQEDLSKTLGDAARNLWPLVDHLGTVRDLAKQDGTIAAHYKYDSFGRVTSGDTSKTRYLFTSRGCGEVNRSRSAASTDERPPSPTPQSPSTSRLTQPGETYFHYGYGEQAPSFGGGLRPGGYATPDPNLSGLGAKDVLNLPPRVPPDAMDPVKPTPGTSIIGPRPVVAGTGSEVLFPKGTGPGTVGPPTAVPLRPR